DSPLAACINPNTGAPGDYVCAQPGVPLYGNSPNGQPPFNAWTIIDNYRTPMVHYYHATFQREIFRSNAVTVSYVMSRGRDLNWFRDINGPPLGTPLDKIQQSRPFYSVAPDLKHIIQMNNDGKSWYDAMQLSYRQNNWHGINSQYNYTLSKCEDYNSDNSRGRNDFPQANNPYNPAANRGPCGFDRRHNFNVGGVYAVPGGSHPVTRGWEVGTVVTALSGRPFTPNIGSRDNLGSAQSTNVRSGLFGTIGSTPDVDAGNPVIAQGGPRSMQWAVKVLF